MQDDEGYTWLLFFLCSRTNKAWVRRNVMSSKAWNVGRSPFHDPNGNVALQVHQASFSKARVKVGSLSPIDHTATNKRSKLERNSMQQWWLPISCQTFWTDSCWGKGKKGEGKGSGTWSWAFLINLPFKTWHLKPGFRISETSVLLWGDELGMEHAQEKRLKSWWRKQW